MISTWLSNLSFGGLLSLPFNQTISSFIHYPCHYLPNSTIEEWRCEYEYQHCFNIFCCICSSLSRNVPILSVGLFICWMQYFSPAIIRSTLRASRVHLKLVMKMGTVLKATCAQEVNDIPFFSWFYSLFNLIRRSWLKVPVVLIKYVSVPFPCLALLPNDCRN